MMTSNDYAGYAAKMRRLAISGTDLEVAARFVDMMAPRESTVLDIGCGIGSSVAALRAAGHEAFGIDPTTEVLQVAQELYDESWFRQVSVSELSTGAAPKFGLPERFDIVVMSGNVPAFLTEDELATTFSVVATLLGSGGHFVIGTTAHHRGGPVNQDRCAAATVLSLKQRFSDWHLGEFTSTSVWSVSVFNAPGSRQTTYEPDGIHVLPPKE